MKYIKCLLFLIIATNSPLLAQLNIKIGYNIGYTNPTLNNEIITRFNEDHTYVGGLKELHTLHGIQAGLRYRVGNLGLEATWNNKFQSTETSGTNPNTNTSLYRKLSFRYGSYSFGTELYLSEFIGLGASIDADNIRYRLESIKNGTRSEIFSQWGLGSHFYISLNIPGNDILTLSIKPYVQIPWTKTDISNLETSLNPDYIPAIDESDYQQDYLNFGIMLIFYNGEW